MREFDPHPTHHEVETVMNKIGQNYVLSVQEIKALVNGKFQARKCTQCYGNGWYWVHEDGTKRDPQAGESHDDFYQHACEFDEDECKELGFHIKYDHEDESTS